MGLSQEFRRHPFVAVKALVFLIIGTVALWQSGLWDNRLLISLLIFVLPLGLRIALVMPKVRPIVVEHPGVLRWPYCSIALLMGSAIALPTLPPLFGAELGYPWGHAAADWLWSLETPALLALATAGFVITVLAAIRLKKVFVSSNCKSALLDRPVLASAGLLLLPIPASVATASSLLVVASPYAAFNAADWFFRSVYAVEAAAGAVLILIVFPVALCRSLYRSTRTLLYGESFDAQMRG